MTTNTPGCSGLFEPVIALTRVSFVVIIDGIGCALDKGSSGDTVVIHLAWDFYKIPSSPKLSKVHGPWSSSRFSFNVVVHVFSWSSVRLRQAQTKGDRWIANPWGTPEHSKTDGVFLLQVMPMYKPSEDDFSKHCVGWDWCRLFRRSHRPCIATVM